MISINLPKTLPNLKKLRIFAIELGKKLKHLRLLFLLKPIPQLYVGYLRDGRACT